MNAGEETVGGVSAPPGRIVNVAGILTLAEPPAGVPARDTLADVVAAEELVGSGGLVVLFARDAAGLAELLVALAARVVVGLGKVVVVGLAEVLLVGLAEVVVAVGLGEVVVVAVELVEECEALPHAATNRNTGRQLSADRRRLTRSA